MELVKINDEVDCCQKLIKEMKNKINEIPVIIEFLNNTQNKLSFDNFIKQPNQRNLDILNLNFMKFYRINRIVRYMSGLIKRYPIDYDKRVKLRNNRYQLIMDKPLNNGSNEPNITIGDTVKSNTVNPMDVIIKLDEKIRLQFEIKNQLLSHAFNQLNDKQKKILYLYYELGFNNKEIGHYFNQSEQNISYWHKKTLKELRENLVS